MTPMITKMNPMITKTTMTCSCVNYVLDAFLGAFLLIYMIDKNHSMRLFCINESSKYI